MLARMLFRLSAAIVSVGALSACSTVGSAVDATINGAGRMLSSTPAVAPAPPVDLDKLTWQALPQSKAVEVAILGSDEKTGATRVAVKVAANQAVPPFFHDVMETHTVVKGSFVFDGIDSAGRPSKIVQGPGKFASVPARMIQRVRAQGSESVMLVTVYGPWAPNFVGDDVAGGTQHAQN